MKWVELKHFQHGYLCLEHIYYWTSAIIKMNWKRFGWCWNTFNIDHVKTCVWSMSVTEHLLSWNISTIIRNLFGCQRPQWVQLFRGSIDALVFKYCQIGKQNAISNAQILFERWIETFNYSARVIWKNIKTFRAGALKYSQPYSIWNKTFGLESACVVWKCLYQNMWD